MWTREELKNNAKKAMTKHYWKMLGVTIVTSLLMGDIFISIYESFSTLDNAYYNYYLTFSDSPVWNEFIISVLEMSGLIVAGSILVGVFSFIYNIFVANVLLIGEAKFFLNARQDQGNMIDVFYSFKHEYFNAVKIMFIQSVKIFLWTLLFIIPGIIKSYEYFMIPYLLAEDPAMPCSKAFELTKELTNNQKWNIFVLELSFIGWNLLGLLACGIGLYFVVPYITATNAELYIKLKEIKHINIGYTAPPIPEY